MRLGFLILHYLAIETTIECVTSITENIDTDDYCIIIVDNASPNNSGELLREKYKDSEKIKVLLNDTNAGFARGNNVGFKYAKIHEKCECICMLNNDTILEQKDFYQSINRIWQQHKCDVIGPQIILRDGTVNKICEGIQPVNKYKMDVFCYMGALFKMYLHMDNITFIKRNGETPQNKVSVDTDAEHKNIVLHGCCLIFMPSYIKCFDGIDDRTYMYKEEELLFLRLMKNGMSSLYTPEIRIRHIEDVATDMVTSDARRKKKYLYKNQIKSTRILIKELNQMKKSLK